MANILDTITDALKLEQFGHEDGDVVSSGTRVIIYLSYYDTPNILLYPYRYYF